MSKINDCESNTSAKNRVNCNDQNFIANLMEKMVYMMMVKVILIDSWLVMVTLIWLVITLKVPDGKEASYIYDNGESDKDSTCQIVD